MPTHPKVISVDHEKIAAGLISIMDQAIADGVMPDDYEAALTLGMLPAPLMLMVNRLIIEKVGEEQAKPIINKVAFCFISLCEEQGRVHV